MAPRADPGDAQPASFPGHPGQEGGESCGCEDDQWLLALGTTQAPLGSTRKGAGATPSPRSPGPARPRTCPTTARTEVLPRVTVSGSHLALCPRLLRQLPSPRPARRGGHLPLPPAAPVPPRPGWAGQSRTFLSDWGQEEHLGPPRRRPQRVFPEVQPGVPATGLLDPRARPPALRGQGSRGTEERTARSFYLPACPVTPHRRSPQLPRLPALTDAQRKVPAIHRRLLYLLPPEGASEPARVSLGVVVQGPPASSWAKVLLLLAASSASSRPHSSSAAE
jgi:hypothetical protein